MFNACFLSPHCSPATLNLSGKRSDLIMNPQKFSELPSSRHRVIFTAEDERVLNLPLYSEVTETLQLREPFQLSSTIIFFSRYFIIWKPCKQKLVHNNLPTVQSSSVAFINILSRLLCGNKQPFHCSCDENRWVYVCHSVHPQFFFCCCSDN